MNALQKALGLTGTRPGIFNTDQGSQFTSEEWTGRLTELGIAISMDGKGRWMDNVFIERLWHSVKFGEIYVKERPPWARCGQAWKISSSDIMSGRPHAALGNLTPCAYYDLRLAAALEEATKAFDAA